MLKPSFLSVPPSKKIRASYSFLNQWAQGNVQEALLSYFHVPHPTPWNFVEGRKWDDYCQEYIKKHGSLPPEWGGDGLSAPDVQKRLKAPYNAICELVGVLDIYDKQIIYELKSGHSNSARAYANNMQVPMYVLLGELNGLPVKAAMVIRYNPKSNAQDRAIIYPSSRVTDKARNWIDSIVPEIWQYFEDNNLWEKTEEDMAKLLKP